VVAMALYTIQWNAPLGGPPAFVNEPTEEMKMQISTTAAYAQSAEFQRIAATGTRQMFQCHVNTGGTSDRPPVKCVGGDVNASVTVILTGDSHTVPYIPAVHVACKHLGVRLRYFSKGSCPMVDIKEHASSEGCKIWRTAVWKELRREFNRTHPFDLIIQRRASSGKYRLKDLAWYNQSVTQFLSTLGSEGLGKRVMLVRDNPWASR
jgi:hypothetical protein